MQKLLLRLFDVVCDFTGISTRSLRFSIFLTVRNHDAELNRYCIEFILHLNIIFHFYEKVNKI